MRVNALSTGGSAIFNPLWGAHSPESGGKDPRDREANKWNRGRNEERGEMARAGASLHEAPGLKQLAHNFLAPFLVVVTFVLNFLATFFL